MIGGVITCLVIVHGFITWIHHNICWIRTYKEGKKLFICIVDQGRFLIFPIFVYISVYDSNWHELLLCLSKVEKWGVKVLRICIELYIAVYTKNLVNRDMGEPSARSECEKYGISLFTIKDTNCPYSFEKTLSSAIDFIHLWII